MMCQSSVTKSWYIKHVGYKGLVVLHCRLWDPTELSFEIKSYYILRIEPGSSVSIVSGYGLDDRAIQVRCSAEAKGLYF
jgi:hypothetical protein